MMIDVKELRVGNRILGLYDDEEELWDQCTVIALDHTGDLFDFTIMVESDQSNSEYFYDMKGIDLNLDLLKQYGFTEEQFSKTTHKYYVLCLPEDEDAQNPFFYTKDGKTVQLLSAENEMEIASVDKLHDLQNLYYLLTKTELIKK